MQQKNYINNSEFIKYQFLAVKIANRYKHDNVELQDLIQASYLGLVIGINKCSIIDEKHKINYLSKYILSEIISTIKSYNDYNYNKEYFKTKKIIEENSDLTINELINKFKLKKDLVINILVKDDNKEEIIEDNTHYLTENQKQLYNFVVTRKFSITKICKLLNIKKSLITSQLKEIYSLLKK